MAIYAYPPKTGRKVTMKAAIYVRISQDHAGEGLGVSRQLEDCQQLADSLNWEVVEIYRDNDISATSGKARPDFRRMLDDATTGMIEGVITWHPDRLYRNVKDLGVIVDVCKAHNIQVATVKAGNVDLTTPTGRLVAGLLAQVATYEGEAKADRWRRSVLQRRESGQAPGWGPRLFGYNRDDTINEDERPIVDWMVAELLDGTNLTRLCRLLNERGSTTTLGNPWRLAALRKFLTNPRLAGYATLNGDIIAAGRWQPIIDPETWEAVRVIAATKRPGLRAAPRVALLVGLTYCGKCGAKMITAGRSRRASGEPQRIYRCPTRPGEAGCGGVSADARAVEEVVESYARTRLNDPRVRASVERLRAASGDGAAAAEMASLERRIVELEAQLGEPGIPVTTILRAVDHARERLDQLTRSVASSNRTSLPTRGGAWPTDLARRASLVRLVVDRVTINPATGRSGLFDPKRVEIADR